MSLEIVRSGVLDTVQDAGRQGVRSWGIGPGGAMDAFASQVANALVGNAVDAAVLEMHFPAPYILFHRNTLISVTGAEFSPTIHGEEIPPWKPVIVNAGRVLTFSRNQRGTRCYLAVHGGLDVPRWLTSRSTNLKINAGGFQGRALKKGDVLPIHPQAFATAISDVFKDFPWSVNYADTYRPKDEVGFVPGHEWDWLSQSAQAGLVQQSFAINSASDRMAIHVDHEPFTVQKKKELLSSAVCAGTIQALPGGKLLILMADHQTTGGYPKIGHIATAHLPRLAQLRAGERFRLKKITVADAEKMLLSSGKDLHDIQEACFKKLKDHGIIR